MTGGCEWVRESLVAEEGAFGESWSAEESELGANAKGFGDPLLCMLPGGGGTSGDSEDCMLNAADYRGARNRWPGRVRTRLGMLPSQGVRVWLEGREREGEKY